MVEAARGPMLAVTDPTVKKITVMGPTQLLKTELINNIVGYFIDQDPAPMIVMQPTEGMAETWSKDRLDKMVRDTPVLRDKVSEKRSKEGENTILHKTFPGGHITMVGSNSPAQLASRPIRIVLCDEVDKYPASAGDEGDPIKLLQERSDTFWNALHVQVCSPTVKDRSRIEAEYNLSDKREFHGRCPHCDELDHLKWSNVKWNKKNPEETACYICSQCETPWSEPDRLKAIANGEYVATAEFNGHAGFHCNKLASPWQPVSVLVKKYLECGKDPEKLKTFNNTQLAETWEEVGEVPDWKRLYERREAWPTNKLQPGITFLTCGADVQKDRIEVEIVGWNREKQSWSVDFRVLTGNPLTPDPWLKLDTLLNETWMAPDGRELQIRTLCVDSGYETQAVYDWVRSKSADRIMAIKGSDNLQMAFGSPRDVEFRRDGERLARAAKYWPVGVSVLKSELYGWLKLDSAGDDGKFPPGFCHIPQYDEEHFKRLCSEQLVKRKVNGKTAFKWIKVHERNEVLDCRVYARAAAAIFGMDRFNATDWDILEGKFDFPRPKTDQKREETKPITPPDLKVKTPSLFLNRNKKIW